MNLQGDKDSGCDAGLSEMSKEWRSGKLIGIVIPEEADAIPKIGEIILTRSGPAHR